MLVSAMFEQVIEVNWVQFVVDIRRISMGSSRSRLRPDGWRVLSSACYLHGEFSSAFRTVDIDGVLKNEALTLMGIR